MDPEYRGRPGVEGAVNAVDARYPTTRWGLSKSGLLTDSLNSPATYAHTQNEIRLSMVAVVCDQYRVCVRGANVCLFCVRWGLMTPSVWLGNTANRAIGGSEGS